MIRKNKATVLLFLQKQTNDDLLNRHSLQMVAKCAKIPLHEEE